MSTQGIGPPIAVEGSTTREVFEALLRKAEARAREALIEAMGEAISVVTGSDARGYFAHCGYGPVGQLR